MTYKSGVDLYRLSSKSGPKDSTTKTTYSPHKPAVPQQLCLDMRRLHLSLALPPIPPVIDQHPRPQPHGQQTSERPKRRRRDLAPGYISGDLPA